MNDDCKGGQLCADGFCQLRKSCSDDSICSIGQYCDLDDKLCKVGCLKDAHCPEFENCDTVLRKCKPILCGPKAKSPTPLQEPCYTGNPDHVKDNVSPDKRQCQKGMRDCIEEGRAWSLCFGESLPAAKEICDMQDNDCNGQIDEGLDCTCTLGAWQICDRLPKGTQTLSATSSAACIKGIQYCVPSLDDKTKGRWGACLGDRLPRLTKESLEKCEITDGNCDGQLDPPSPQCACTKEQVGTTRPCYRGDLASKGKGECKGGSQKCEARCYLSSDSVDKCSVHCEEEAAQSEQKTEAKNRCMQRLTYYRWTVCTLDVLPKPEEHGDCNGKDDDCDGRIDNRSDEPGKVDSQLSRPCYPSEVAGCDAKGNCQGVCKGGIEVCQKDKGWSLCQGAVVPAKEECNGKDDDCNGQIDDGISFRLCYTGAAGCIEKSGKYECVGECKAGSQQCDNGKWGKCEREQVAKEESKAAGNCNDGLDNDCDGNKDEADPDCK